MLCAICRERSMPSCHDSRCLTVAAFKVSPTRNLTADIQSYLERDAYIHTFEVALYVCFRETRSAVQTAEMKTFWVTWEGGNNATLSSEMRVMRPHRPDCSCAPIISSSASLGLLTIKSCHLLGMYRSPAAVCEGLRRNFPPIRASLTNLDHYNGYRF